MKRRAAVVFAGIALASCTTAQPADPMIFIRTDGQSVKDNPAVEQQFEIDKTICLGQTQATNLSSNPVFTNNVLINAEITDARVAQITDVAVGCMAGRGYVYVPLSQAPARAAELKAAAAAGAIGTKPAGGVPGTIPKP
jgi:hypothetical protein